MRWRRQRQKGDEQANNGSEEEVEEVERVVVLETEREGRTSKRYKFDQDTLDEFFHGADPYDMSHHMKKLSLKYNGTDIITAICQNVELAVELGKYLHARDIINLYIANHMFHNAVNEHLLSSMKMWIAASAPEAGKIFSFKLYRRLLTHDPSGRKIGDVYPHLRSEKLLSQWMMQRTRTIPGLKYVQLVLGRDQYCREMIAMLARNGHRCPPTMHSTMLKIWLLMDVSTTRQRQALLRNTDIWTDVDLYNAQFFFIKLGMHFNDPVYGPNTYDLLFLMMGQRGLYPLWQLLMHKKYTKLPELLELSVRYNFDIPPDHWGGDFFDSNLHGVPFDEVGIGHFEGWGMGDQHLMRPDELIPFEAVTRGLDLDEHIRYMMVWGYVDFKTGNNLVPTEEEMYISDDERVLAHMDTTHHWRRKHVLKKRWTELTPEQQQDIIEEDLDDQLRAMAWCGEDSDFDAYASDDEEKPYDLDDEIERGYILSQQPKDHKSDVPPLDDEAGWSSFVNDALIGLPPQLTPDELLQAQAWHSYQDKERDYEWDWLRWLDAERNKDGTVPSNDDWEEDGDIDYGDEADVDDDDDDDHDDSESDGEAEPDWMQENDEASALARLDEVYAAFGEAFDQDVDALLNLSSTQ